jgi:hypothetical protein
VASKALIFERVNWSPQVAAGLARATYPEENFISNEVKTGICQCWHIHDHGYLVTRFEVEPDHKTLVIVAGQGRGLVKVLKAVYNVAKANKAKQIRLHSRRAGMVRMLEKLGYTVVYGLGENVFFKRVA